MSLTVVDVQRFSELDALEFIRRAKWPRTGGGAVCQCGSDDTYRMSTRALFRCKRCRYQFSEFSCSAFASSKLQARDLLTMIAEFATARKGISALQICRNHGLHYKTAFTTLHKLRDVMHEEQRTIRLFGVVEIDGAQFGGYRRVENQHSGRFMKRMCTAHLEERRVLVVARQRFGRTLTFVGKSEMDSVENIHRQLEKGTIIQADGAHAWDGMKEAYEMLRIEHSFAYSANDACTNNAESFFSMMRRMQRGTHHRMSGDLLHLYASEMAWRQDFKSESAEQLIERLTRMALQSWASDWKGYWQKAPTKKVKPNVKSVPDEKDDTSLISVEVAA